MRGAARPGRAGAPAGKRPLVAKRPALRGRCKNGGRDEAIDEQKARRPARIWLHLDGLQRTGRVPGIRTGHLRASQRSHCRGRCAGGGKRAHPAPAPW
jgi:hypothetical protein